jgi:hypothetical protein
VKKWAMIVLKPIPSSSLCSSLFLETKTYLSSRKKIKSVLIFGFAGSIHYDKYFQRSETRKESLYFLERTYYF